MATPPYHVSAPLGSKGRGPSHVPREKCHKPERFAPRLAIRMLGATRISDRSGFRKGQESASSSLSLCVEDTFVLVQSPSQDYSKHGDPSTWKSKHTTSDFMQPTTCFSPLLSSRPQVSLQIMKTRREAW